MSAPGMTEADVRAAFRRFRARRHHGEHLALGEAYAVAVVRGMAPKLAATLCGLSFTPADQSQGPK